MTKNKEVVGEAPVAIELNPRLIQWPTDTTGRLGPLKEALFLLAGVRNAENAAVIQEALEIACEWFPARVAANIAEDVSKEERREKRIAVEAKERARKQLVAAKADARGAHKEALRTRDRVDELQKLARG